MRYNITYTDGWADTLVSGEYMRGIDPGEIAAVYCVTTGRALSDAEIEDLVLGSESTYEQG